MGGGGGGAGAYGVGMWKNINKEAAVFKQFCNFAVGDGRRVRFWEDTWFGIEPMSETFPNIYSMANTKGGFLANFFLGGLGGWNPTFLCSFNDSEHGPSDVALL